MTQDDTFRALKRTPWAEIVTMQEYWDVDDGGPDSSYEDLEEFLAPHGWTVEEFDIADIKYNIYNPQHVDYVASTDPADYIHTSYR